MNLFRFAPSVQGRGKNKLRDISCWIVLLYALTLFALTINAETNATIAEIESYNYSGINIVSAEQGDPDEGGTTPTLENDQTDGMIADEESGENEILEQDSDLDQEVDPSEKGSDSETPTIETETPEGAQDQGGEKGEILSPAEETGESLEENEEEQDQTTHTLPGAENIPLEASVGLFESNPSDIQLTAEITSANQTVQINQYFANAYTVDRGDGSPIVTLTADTIHTYATVGEYTITLSLAGGASRWTFNYFGINKPLVPKSGTTANEIYLSSIPSLTDYFGVGTTNPGDYFFSYFNYNGALTSLPEGSFDTSKITTVGSSFFYSFNNNGKLTSLPEGSFDTSKITIVGHYFFTHFNRNGVLTSLPERSFNITNIATAGGSFFSNFNSNGALTSLPAESFNTSNITTVGTNFFSQFNYNGALISLPDGSFNTSNIRTAGNDFFNSFNGNGKLTSLPENSFNTSNITTVGNNFFSSFNSYGALTTLPEGGFDTSNITTVGSYFFSTFNSNGALTTLPERSFDTSNITTVGHSFFSNFNFYGTLTSLPENSFDTSNITTVGNDFFSHFNRNGVLTSLPERSFNITNIATAGGSFFSNFNSNGNLTSLPEGSFDTSNITTVGHSFFSNFNSNGNLTSLPEGSFDTSKITTVGGSFFYYFNSNGALTSLPENSFDTSNITTVGNDFFSSFNGNGALTSLPENSFDTSKITTVGNYFFNLFNYNGALTSLPEGSFDTSNITTVGNYFFSSFNQNGALIKASNTGVAIKNPSSSAVTFYFKTPAGASSYQNIANGSSFQYYATPIKTYTVTFKDHDASILATQTVNHGSDATAPTDPTRVGYSFAGWDKAYHNITADTTVTATYHIDNYTTTYHLDGGTNAINNPSSYTIETPTFSISDPSKLGYSFDGWYDAASGGSKITAIAKGSTGDKTLYARWTINQYDVNFESNGGSPVADQTVHYANPIPQPTSPTKIGHSFAEWYKESGLTTAWDFANDTMPAYNITLYAKWNINSYTVTFKDHDASILATQTVNHGSDAIVPVDPTRVGYSFAGWDKAYHNITADTTVTATYHIDNYTVSYHLDGGTNDLENPNNYTIETATITLKVPSKLGYSFDGWYDAASGGSKITAITQGSTGDKTFYARWTINQYEVVFESNGGSLVASQVIQYGESPQIPETPSKEGYEFLGWFEEKGIEAFDFNTPITENLMLYAQWVEKKANTSSSGGFATGKDKNPTANTNSDHQTSQQSEQGNTNSKAMDTPVILANSLEKYIQDKKSEPEQLTTMFQVISSTKEAKVSQELKDAYTYSYIKGITTQETLEKAALDRGLTRAEMAKMMVVFAKDLGKEKEIDTGVSYADTALVTDDLADYIQQAYQMQIMGIDTEGNPLENFNPHKTVTRGEFATVLSRVLFGNTYNQEGNLYSEKHLLALKERNILNDIDANREELRGWVMLMLMRSEKLR